MFKTEIGFIFATIAVGAIISIVYDIYVKNYHEQPEENEDEKLHDQPEANEDKNQIRIGYRVN